MSSAYYDTNILEHSFNPSTAFHSDCAQLVEPTVGSWRVVISHWVRAELQNDEFINSWVVQFLTNGRELNEIDAAATERLKREKRGTKDQLRKLGMSSVDINHAFSAAAGQADFLTTNDPDFWDPAQKEGGEEERVKELLQQQLSILVETSSEACARLGL